VARAPEGRKPWTVFVNPNLDDPSYSTSTFNLAPFKNYSCTAQKSCLPHAAKCRQQELNKVTGIKPG
jgi:hypothetical protein